MCNSTCTYEHKDPTSVNDQIIVMSAMLGKAHYQSACVLDVTSFVHSLVMLTAVFAIVSPCSNHVSVITANICLHQVVSAAKCTRQSLMNPDFLTKCSRFVAGFAACLTMPIVDMILGIYYLGSMLLMLQGTET